MKDVIKYPELSYYTDSPVYLASIIGLIISFRFVARREDFQTIVFGVFMLSTLPYYILNDYLYFLNTNLHIA
jgi:hypothetical protein